MWQSLQSGNLYIEPWWGYQDAGNREPQCKEAIVKSTSSKGIALTLAIKSRVRTNDSRLVPWTSLLFVCLKIAFAL